MLRTAAANLHRFPTDAFRRLGPRIVRAGLLAALALVAGPAVPGLAPATAQNVRTPLQDDWHFRQVGTDTWLPATVPGVNFTDLLANGLIPDPYFGRREPALQWIEDEDWEYRTSLELTEMDGDWHTEIVFHGLDTFAEVRVDGELLLETDNMFRPWRLTLSGPASAPGVHDVHITFRSPIALGDSLYRAYPIPLHAGHDPNRTRPFIRKAAYHFGWDWGPRYVMSGIWRPVTVHRWRGATIRDAYVAQQSLTDERAELEGRLQVEADFQGPAAIVVRSPDGRFQPVEVERELSPGMNDVAVPFEIADPERWWPNGLGDPTLYGVTLEVRRGPRGSGRSAATDLLDAAEEEVGLRTLRLVTEPDSIGESFYFEVNGEPVFMKGANTIPLDHFSTRVDSAAYQRMFDDVVDAHMNMLRIWGGGIYETERFYRMADRAGILIWQDFMFANGLYPDTPEFLASVRAEAEHQVRRLRRHPSLALWCGNNEIREAWDNWGWQRMMGYSPADSARAWRAYERVFHELLPGVVEALDPGRRYWPSSPSLSWGDPESLRRGDSHYWGVWFGEEPFEVLMEKRPRFMSEFGFQGYPPLSSIRRFTDPADRQVGSEVMLGHEKNSRGDELIRLYMLRNFPAPRDFADWVYLSQLTQARGMALGLEAQRRAMPRTMGTLYWQLGDTWPAVSWSGIDGYGAWKALHYYVRRAYAPVRVSPVLDDEGPGDPVVRVHIVSDRLRPVTADLTVRTITFEGTEVFRTERAVELPANGSAVALELDVDTVMGRTTGEPGADLRSTVLVAELSLPGGAMSRHLLYFARPKELALRDPGITTALRREHDGWVVDVHARSLAYGVQLTADPDLDGADAPHFSDNWFDLLPGETRTVRIERLPASDDRPEVRVRSLADSEVR